MSYYLINKKYYLTLVLGQFYDQRAQIDSDQFYVNLFISVYK